MNITKITNKTIQPGISSNNNTARNLKFFQQQIKHLRKLDTTDILATEVPSIMAGKNQMFASFEEFEVALKRANSNKILTAARELLDSAATKLAKIFKK